MCAHTLMRLNEIKSEKMVNIIIKFRMVFISEGEIGEWAGEKLIGY